MTTKERKSPNAVIFIMIAVRCVYHIWKEKNLRVFQERARGATLVSRLSYKRFVKEGI